MSVTNKVKSNLIDKIKYNRQDANTFLSRKLLANSWHHFEEIQQGNLEKECLEEICSWEEAREVFEIDRAGLNKFWAQYTGQTDNSSMDNPVGLVVGIVFGVLALIIILVVVYMVWNKNRSLNEMVDTGPGDRYPTLHYYSKKQSVAPGNNYETPLLDKLDNELALGLSECYVERERLQLEEVITSGNFGDIWKGELRLRDNRIVNVAVKSLKQIDDQEDVQKFLREGVMMRGLDHKHVLSLLGVCMDSDIERCQTSPLIILPFMKNGDLRTFLRDGNNVLTVLHLIRFCYQVALGMEYLAAKKFVHRDLAARNCMVDEKWRVKVADFGLSRDLYDRDYYKSSIKTQLPLKWMSPESIKYGRYNEKTDSWSYGVVCWEIMTRGSIPYPTILAVNILDYLKEGRRMERPECCPFKLYTVMKKCWDEDPDTRLAFEELVRSLSNILHDARQSIKNKKDTSPTSSPASANPYQNMTDNYASKHKPKPRTSQSSIDRTVDKVSKNSPTKTERLNNQGNLSDSTSRTSSMNRMTGRKIQI